MADGKWIDGLAPEMKAVDAARKVLAVRWAVVCENLPLAAHRADEDIEFVHQLRVGSRRASAALRAFRPLIPKEEYKEARNLLRTVRRAAGSARDWDVFLSGMGQSRAMKLRKSQPAELYLVGYAMGHRAAAQESLVSVMLDHRDDLDEWNDRLPDVVRPAKNEDIRTFRDLAEVNLNPLFRTLSADIAMHPTRPEELHQLRITGKRVRYAMELFASCYAPAFRETLYPAIADMQEHLGIVQDSHVAESRLLAITSVLEQNHPTVAKKVSPGLTAFIEEHRTAAQNADDAFRKWVTEWEELTATHPLAELLSATSG